MSAFMVSAAHVAALVRWYAANDRQSMQWAGLGSDRAAIATMLHAENAKSINYRYQDDDEKGHEFTEREIDAARQLSPVEVLKAASCYEYQACEHPTWESSQAAKFTLHLKAAAIAKLPGYEEAPWGIA